MNIYLNNNNRNAEPIYHSDIVFMTNQLGEFIKVYEDKIYIDSDESKEALCKLKDIYNKLKNEQYQDLINDTSIIVYDDDISHEFTDVPF